MKQLQASLQRSSGEDTSRRADLMLQEQRIQGTGNVSRYYVCKAWR